MAGQITNMQIFLDDERGSVPAHMHQTLQPNLSLVEEQKKPMTAAPSPRHWRNKNKAGPFELEQADKFRGQHDGSSKNTSMSGLLRNTTDKSVKFQGKKIEAKRRRTVMGAIDLLFKNEGGGRKQRSRSRSIRELDTLIGSQDDATKAINSLERKKLHEQMMQELHPLSDKKLAEIFPVLNYFKSRKMSGKEMREQVGRALRAQVMEKLKEVYEK